jgi:broad specificity polyphosphatase/5'/3'-nucleotidase SurE
MESTQKKYKILVSNDDGIDAPGVLSIVEEVHASPNRTSCGHFR